MTAKELREAFPSYGPDWEAAIDYGIDVSLLVRNLEMTVEERLLQLQAMNELYEEARRNGPASETSRHP